MSLEFNVDKIKNFFKLFGPESDSAAYVGAGLRDSAATVLSDELEDSSGSLLRFQGLQEPIRFDPHSGRLELLNALEGYEFAWGDDQTLEIINDQGEVLVSLSLGGDGRLSGQVEGVDVHSLSFPTIEGAWVVSFDGNSEIQELFDRSQEGLPQPLVALMQYGALVESEPVSFQARTLEQTESDNEILPAQDGELATLLSLDAYGRPLETGKGAGSADFAFYDLSTANTLTEPNSPLHLHTGVTEHGVHADRYVPGEEVGTVTEIYPGFSITANPDLLPENVKFVQFISRSVNVDDAVVPGNTTFKGHTSSLHEGGEFDPSSFKLDTQKPPFYGSSLFSDSLSQSGMTDNPNGWQGGFNSLEWPEDLAGLKLPTNLKTKADRQNALKTLLEEGHTVKSTAHFVTYAYDPETNEPVAEIKFRVEFSVDQGDLKYKPNGDLDPSLLGLKMGQGYDEVILESVREIDEFDPVHLNILRTEQPSWRTRTESVLPDTQQSVIDIVEDGGESIGENLYGALTTASDRNAFADEPGFSDAFKSFLENQWGTPPQTGQDEAVPGAPTDEESSTATVEEQFDEALPQFSELAEQLRNGDIDSFRMFGNEVTLRDDVPVMKVGSLEIGVEDVTDQHISLKIFGPKWDFAAKVSIADEPGKFQPLRSLLNNADTIEGVAGRFTALLAVVTLAVGLDEAAEGNYVQAGETLGGLAVSYAGATAGAAIGAAVAGPVGAVVGGLIGAGLGGVLGSHTGGDIGSYFEIETFNPENDPELRDFINNIAVEVYAQALEDNAHLIFPEGEEEVELSTAFDRINQLYEPKFEAGTLTEEEALILNAADFFRTPEALYHFSHFHYFLHPETKEPNGITKTLDAAWDGVVNDTVRLENFQAIRGYAHAFNLFPQDPATPLELPAEEQYEIFTELSLYLEQEGLTEISRGEMARLVADKSVDENLQRALAFALWHTFDPTDTDRSESITQELIEAQVNRTEALLFQESIATAFDVNFDAATGGAGSHGDHERIGHRGSQGMLFDPVTGDYSAAPLNASGVHLTTDKNYFEVMVPGPDGDDVPVLVEWYDNPPLQGGPLNGMILGGIGGEGGDSGSHHGSQHYLGLPGYTSVPSLGIAYRVVPEGTSHHHLPSSRHQQAHDELESVVSSLTLGMSVDESQRQLEELAYLEDRSTLLPGEQFAEREGLMSESGEYYTRVVGVGEESDGRLVIKNKYGQTVWTLTDEHGEEVNTSGRGLASDWFGSLSINAELGRVEVYNGDNELVWSRPQVGATETTGTAESFEEFELKLTDSGELIFYGVTATGYEQSLWSSADNESSDETTNTAIVDDDDINEDKDDNSDDQLHGPIFDFTNIGSP